MEPLERVPSERILQLAQRLEAPLQMFLRREDGLTRTGFASRVLDLGPERHRSLIVEAPVRGAQRYPIHPDDQIEFFFEVDGVGYAFGTPVEERVRFALNDRVQLPALRMQFPAELIKIQRRSYYRALAPPDPPILVRLRLTRPDETPEDRLFDRQFAYKGRLHDISGAGIAVAFPGAPPFEPQIDQRLTTAFRLEPQDVSEIVLDTLVRGITQTDDESHTVLHLGWVNCRENDPDTGAFAQRIFRFVADRQQEIARKRSERLRRSP